MFKMVRKRIENVAEIKRYIKARGKLGLSAESIHDEIRVVYGDKMSFSIGPEVHLGLQFTSFLWVYPKMSMKLS